LNTFRQGVLLLQESLVSSDALNVTTKRLGSKFLSEMAEVGQDPIQALQSIQTLGSRATLLLFPKVIASFGHISIHREQAL
jgi:hypothetical protein